MMLQWNIVRNIMTCFHDVQLDDSTQVKAGETEAAFKDKPVLPFMKRVPVKRVVHLPNITADPIKFSLRYNTSQGTPLPPDAASAVVADFVVTGVDATLSKYNTTGKLQHRQLHCVQS